MNLCSTLFLFLVLWTPIIAFGQSGSDDGVDARADPTEFARQLGNVDPLVRQRAAEALARLAGGDQRKIVEGYHLQEKNKKVRLALDWALYRIGKSEALFRIVRELDSPRHEQAVGYLTLVESPALLQAFLNSEDNPAKTTIGLLGALGHVGDGETLELIRPFQNSFSPGVAEAAEVAADKIKTRLAQKDPVIPTRSRTVGTPETTSP